MAADPSFKFVAVAVALRNRVSRWLSGRRMCWRSSAQRARTSRHSTLPPDKELLQLKDGEETWAEERHERALNGVIRLLAKAAVDNYIAEQSRAKAQPDTRDL